MAFSYSFLRRLGLGAHMAVIIGLAAVPSSLLIVGFIESEHREAEDDARQWARESASHGAEQHRQVIAAAQDVLRVAGERLDMTAAAGAPCDVPAGENRVVVVVSPDGGSHCDSDPKFPLPDTVVAAVLDSTGPAGFSVVGPFETAPRQLAVFGVMTKVDDRGVTWHLLRAIDFDWTPQFYDGLTDASDLVTVALDADGQVIRHANPAGEHDVDNGFFLELDSLLEEIEGDREPDRITGLDEEPRIFGAAAVPEPGITVLVGISHDAVMSRADRELFGSLALLGAVLALSGVVAWLFIERMVLRSIRKLRDAAVATARGESAPRVEIRNGPVELRELARAFNEMTNKLEFQAYHDPLTGLGNRHYIEKRLGALLRIGKPFAVLAIDLDGFKPVNDTYGHATGDFVLGQVAVRLKEGLGDGLFIGRTGGDEFLAAVRLDGEKDREIAADAAQGMLDRLTVPVKLSDGTEIHIAGSVGIAFWHGDGTSVDDVIREADAALYRAKEEGRDRYVGPGVTGRPTRAA